MLPLTSKDSFKSDDFKPGVKLKSRFVEWIKYDDLKELLLSSFCVEIDGHVFVHVNFFT